MGNKYLNKNVRFQCQNGNAVWFSPQDGDKKVKVNGAEILLDNCTLSLIGGPRPGQCNLFLDPSTGAPSPCIAVMVSGKWNNNSNISVGCNKPLLDTCSIMCSRNGSIRPFKPTTVALNINNDAKIQAVDIRITSDSKDIDTDGKNIGDAQPADITEALAENNNQTVENVGEVQYALCDYKNCSKAKECQYLKASHTLRETNESKNAAELKMNMGKDAFDLYAGECGAIATSLYGSYMYSIAHHHIVPVNQCFKTFAEVVKLANYYNYDINKAENGICLPTMNAGYDKEPFELRKKISINAMEKLGKQWHKGGHKYSCNISADLDSVLPRPFYHYKDAVDKELTSLRIKLTDEMKCRSEYYDQQAAEFSMIMDHICEKIAKKLRRFEDDAKKSYPCYISKLAFYYAFQEELSGYEDELFGKDG